MVTTKFGCHSQSLQGVTESLTVPLFGYLARCGVRVDVGIKPVVLIVDDDKDIRDILSKIAESRLNADVYQTESGKEALDLLHRHHIDVIICDLGMPVMGGVNFYETLRSRAVTTPVIFLTGQSQEAAPKLFSLGAYDFLQKPFNTEDLCILLEDAYKTSQRLHKIRDEKKRGLD